MEGIFAISLANSIRFAKVETGDRNFDNTLECDVIVRDGEHKGYAQRFLTTDAVKIQIKTEYGTVTAKLYDIDGNLISSPTVSTDTTYTDFDFKSFEIDMSLLTADSYYYLVVDATDGSFDAVQYQSEIFRPRASLTDHLHIEYTNADNAFELDYEMTTIDHVLRVHGRLLLMKPSTERDVYSNQGRKVTIRAVVNRVLVLECEPMPRYLAEKIQIAMAHDQLTINGKEYVSEEGTEIERFGRTNLYVVRADLTQVDVVGLNTDDSGFDCNGGTSEVENVKNFRLTGVVGSDSVSISGYENDFYIDKVIIELTAGTGGNMKAGFGVAGGNVMRETDCSGYVISTPVPVDVDAVPDGQSAVYFTLSGGSGAVYNISLVLIRYKTTI